MKINLPSQYVEYVEQGGLAEGFTGGGRMPGYFALWPLGDIKAWNKDYEVEEYAPGFLGFGGDGGGEMLAFDSSGAVFVLPLIGMEPDQAIKVAESWQEFAQRIEQPSE